MEPNHNLSRKRKQPPNPLHGTLTRSKSQIYSHLTRSGRHRFDSAAFNRPHRKSPLRRHYHHHKQKQQHHHDATLPTVRLESPTRFLIPAVKNPQALDRVKDDEIKFSYVSIKDLRARRVFSKPIGNTSCEILDGLVVKPSLIPEKMNFLPGGGGGGVFVAGGEVDEDNTSKCNNLGFNFEAEEGLSGKNPDLCPEEDNKVNDAAGRELSRDGAGAGVEKLGNSSDNSQKNTVNGLTHGSSGAERSADFSTQQQQQQQLGGDTPDCAQTRNEENVQTTPPDSDILDRMNDDDQNVANTVEKTSGTKDRFAAVSTSLDDKSAKVSGGSQTTTTSPCRRNGAVSRSKLGLNPCTRLKLFKTTSSVSYRRLLPYLMDIANDKSCSIQSNPLSKTANNLEEKPSEALLSQESSAQFQSLEEKTTLKSVADSGSSEKAEEEGKEEGASPVMGVGDSINKNVGMETTSKNDNLPTSSMVSGSQIEAPMIRDDSPDSGLSSSSAPVEQQPELSYANSCGTSPVKGSVHISNSPAEITEPSRRDASTADDLSRPLSSPEGHFSPPNGGEAKNFEDAITVFQSTSPLTAVELPATTGQARGILRKNPKGCRGLCTCLNCSSFRLNAERAFDFSRNQMLESEELVLELMKQLSQVRSILRKSIVDGSSSKAVVQVNQVEEICEKASKAEDRARFRLRQMNEDLFVHCRTKCLERPKVNFTLKAEEKASPSPSPNK